MDDQRTTGSRGTSVLKRILKWFTIAAWSYTLVMVVFTAIQSNRGDLLGYSAGAEVSVLSGSVASVVTCVYLLVAVLEKRSRNHRQ
jgi:hypothetical protein